MRRPLPCYFVCDSDPLVPDAPVSDDFDAFEPVFFEDFFAVFALCFAPAVEPVSLPVALEPIADDSDPDDPLEPIEPDEPLAVDFFDAAFL